MRVDDPTDQSPISEAISLEDRLLLIKEQGVWQVHLSDNIDPDRTNAHIPNTQQKLLARGCADALVGRTLLQARRLLKSSMLRKGFQEKAGLRVALEFLQDIDALQRAADDLATLVADTNDLFLQQRETPGSLKVPAIGNIPARGKSFLQGADHAVRSLHSLIALFYPDVRMGKGWFEKFRARMQKAGEPF